MKKFIAFHPKIFSSIVTLILGAILICVFAFELLPFNKVLFYGAVVVFIFIVIFIEGFADDFSMNYLFELGNAEVAADYKYCIKAEYYYEEACEVYCKQKNKDYDNLNEKDEDKIWEYARNFIAYLVQWLIENDLFAYNEEDGETKELVKKCKARKIKPGKIVQEVCDERLIKDDLVPEVRDFFINYYVEDADDYENFVNYDLKKELYGFGFEWEDYDRWKKYIDREYKKYLEEKNNNE